MRLVSDKNKLATFFRAVYMILSALLLGILYLHRLPFFVGCSVCIILFGFIQIWLVSVSHKDEVYQKKKCKPIGFMLLIPAFGMIANGVALVFLTKAELPNNLANGTIAISAAIIAGSSAHIFIFRKDTSLASKFLRYTDCAALSAPISIIATMAMMQGAGENATDIGCISAILLGVIALLIAVSLILNSLCGYVGTKASIKIVSDMIREKKLVISRAMLVKDGFLVAGKLLISLVSLSFFMFVNGLYSIGMGIGRYIAIKMHSQSEDEQIKGYWLVGIVILFSSACYVLYSIRLFIGDKSATYPMVIAIAIACYTFIEFGINIREIIRLRRSKALEAKALRMLSLSSTLLCFVLTQTALMSFAHEGDPNFFNALSGVVFGSIAALIGLFMVFSAKRISQK